MKQSTYLPQASILLAGVSWGLIGLFSRNLLNAGFSPRDIVLIRNTGGLVLLAIALLAADRSAFRIRPRQLPWCAGTGLVSVLLFTLCYFSCQQHCSLATAAILLYTAPAFVVVMSALLWREPVTKRKLLALGLAFLGCTFVSGVWSGGLSVSPAGLILGLGSAFFYALYSIFGRYALRGSPPMTVVLYTFLFAGGGALLVGDAGAVAAALAADGRLLALALGLAALSTALPYVLYTWGLARVESGKASILASVEPVAAALVGVLAFGEPMTAGVALGLLCILGCVYILR